MSYMKTSLVLVCASLFLITACKKSSNSGGGGNNPPPAPTPEELVMDSVYLFSKEVYFWNDLIPDYNTFNPRKYKGSTELESASNVMSAIRKLQPLDRFSFVTTIEESNGIQTGQDADLGFFV